MKIYDFSDTVKTNPIQTQSKPVLPIPYQIGSCRYLVREAQPALSMAEWVEWANLPQEMPTMPYLPACVKLHYIGTVKAIQLGTSHNLIAILVMGKSRINRRVFYFDSPCGFGYNIGCFS